MIYKLFSALILLFSISACSTIPPDAMTELARRQVSLTAWGISGTSPMGTLWNVGYLQYRRNMPDDIKPAKPGLPTLP